MLCRYFCIVAKSYLVSYLRFHTAFFAVFVTALYVGVCSSTAVGEVELQIKIPSTSTTTSLDALNASLDRPSQDSIPR